jgi:hypothetical protein
MMTFLFVNAFNPSGPFSFQKPDFFTPPKGSDAFDHAGLLINTIPVWICLATALVWSGLSPKTHPHKPKSELLAILTASSRSRALISEATGPKTSCLYEVIVSSTSNIVGA